MKNVMKMFIATAVMGIFTVSAFAQGAGPGGQKGQAGGGNGQTERKAGGGGQRRGAMNMDGEIFAKLNLTDGQKAKIKALKESTQKKMQELMKAAGGPGAGAGAKGGKGGGFAGMREKFKPIMDSYQAGIKGILTPPQFAAYEKGMKEAREKMKKQFGAGGGPGGVGGKGKGKGSTPPPTA